MASKSGITNLRSEHSFDGNTFKVAAYVPEDQLANALDNKKHSYITHNSKQFSRATKFAMIAAHEALEDAELLDPMNQVKENVRYNIGTAIGQGMVDFEDIHENGSKVFGNSEKMGGFKRISPYFITRALINMAGGNISIRYKTSGPNHCVSTACATGVHSIGDAYNFIKYGKADVMICGGTEAAINSLSIAGFGRLRALSSKYNDYPHKASRPFDQDRCGFVIGEGAGIMILEELEHAKSRNFAQNKIYGEILGYGTSSDAHHLTAPPPNGDGAVRCMKEALRDANLHSHEVSHINAHATSTPIGDEIECDAIETLFYPENSRGRDDNVSLTSCKGSIGHLLGAAGSVESIFSILSCKLSQIPPTLNLDRPLTTPRNLIELIRNSPSDWHKDRRILVKNSFGFGGTNASLVISNFIG